MVERRTRSESGTPRPADTPDEIAEIDQTIQEDNIKVEDPRDEEYQENDDDDEDEEDPAANEDADDPDEQGDETIRKNNRRRTRKNSTVKEEEDDEEDDDDDDEDSDQSEGSPSKSTAKHGKGVTLVINPLRRRGRPAKNKKRVSELEEEEIANEVKRKRGRGRIDSTDEEGLHLEVKDDEIVVPVNEDGETKVDSEGHLKGGREYRVRTFTCAGRGNRLYMLSTEPARLMGFRDSYLLFHKHRKLYKVIINDKEKHDLINREILPHSYKGRNIGLVTARSIFREFGARIIKGGKWITDDYDKESSLAEGHVEGELALLPSDEFNRGGTPGFATNKMITPHTQLTQTWIYESALRSRQAESQLYEARSSLSTPRGFKEPYTGVTFIPQHLQPSKVEFFKYDDTVSDKLIITTVMSGSTASATGLKDVPEEIYKDVVTPDVLQAIQEQKLLEERL
ncbi:RSC chromatin remodeling complex component [Komagataella phaffii CBS 7435]|uniref:Chromatin structure-remodeling complex protein RSC7 n=2 Tax=Komagataella phaffii TaxID=460519 RepID=C4QZ38_KOMPG|nr:Chromatin structure-remodeling complex protein RSC7 [Komagataella phaffii GS115]AOA61211.1 GQ67_01485T0 [Komagataella phaffii]CAH2447340.1 RSC chromatin remodeling complex component [Komagataella phaffii CBS 7435]AOA66689.1 GQ68_01501T0 [Komagataella phaffii GS115]CAY68512.1 Chromatin structure-remodeling complex protein RSC7 [Komagataella phaffii GS115]CCA37574.1 RSC chromatin remodeling complex component [Komagataella phaffii CBS 7435]